MEKKDETSAVEIEGLKTIGRIFLAIKARIEPKETASRWRKPFWPNGS